MPNINRRRFLQLAGGTAAASVLTGGIAKAAAIPAAAGTGSLQDVEHVVVLMQENRSFDHYFGTLRGVRGFGDPRPAALPSGKTAFHQADSSGHETLPFRPDADNLGLQFIQDLDHSWSGTHQAWNGGNYDRWIPAKGTTTMAYLTREDIPFHYALADAFTICDAYHCSMLSSTDPNRYYMYTGFTGNDGKGGGPVLGNEEAGYGWTTFPEILEQAGVSWKVYQDAGTGLDAAGGWGWTSDAFIGNYGDNSLLYFDQYRNAQAGDPLYDKARTGTDANGGDGYFDQLKADVLAGKLPQVSWIAAPEAFCEHPNWPANYGAWYVSQVLDALTADPDVWSRTAVFLTYDENDGFFDHVVPPFPPASAARGLSTADVTQDLYTGGLSGYAAGPYGLGPRVPMLVLSPWSTGGWVCSQTFDHTSIVQFIEKRFGVHNPNVSPWRRAVCGDLTAAFDFTRSDTAAPSLPGTGGYVPPNHDNPGDYVPTPPATGAVPKQESGLRNARALPYRPGRRHRAGQRADAVHLQQPRRGGRGLPRHLRGALGRPLALHGRGGQDPHRHLGAARLLRPVRLLGPRAERLPAPDGRHGGLGRPRGDRQGRRLHRPGHPGVQQPRHRPGHLHRHRRVRAHRAVHVHRRGGRLAERPGLGSGGRQRLVRRHGHLQRRLRVRAALRRARGDRRREHQRPGHRDRLTGRPPPRRHPGGAPHPRPWRRRRRRGRCPG